MRPCWGHLCRHLRRLISLWFSVALANSFWIAFRKLARNTKPGTVPWFCSCFSKQQGDNLWGNTHFFNLEVQEEKVRQLSGKEFLSSWTKNTLQRRSCFQQKTKVNMTLLVCCNSMKTQKNWNPQKLSQRTRQYLLVVSTHRRSRSVMDRGVQSFPRTTQLKLCKSMKLSSLPTFNKWLISLEARSNDLLLSTAMVGCYNFFFASPCIFNCLEISKKKNESLSLS